MDEGQHKDFMGLWEQSCQWVQQSCEVAARALARLSDDMVRIPRDDFTAKAIVKIARREIRDAIVKRVDGWLLGDTLDIDRMSRVFEVLASDARCSANTVAQLSNGVRRLREERLGLQVRRRDPGPAGLNTLNVAGGPHRGY